MIRPIFCSLIVSLFLITSTDAQVAMRTDLVEVTIAECGAYGADVVVPGGFHPNTMDGRLSLVADVDRDGWDVPSAAPFCGDYFIPGSVVEGFQIKVDSFPVRANGNRGFGTCEANDIATTFQGFFNFSPANAKVAVWKGFDSLLGLSIEQKTVLFEGELFMITWTQLCNNSGANWDTLYYGRNADPDPEMAWGGGFATQNKVLLQPPTSAGAYLGIRGTSVGCPLGLLAKDSRARVSYGGFFDTDPEDYWNGNTFYSISGGTTADQATQMSFRQVGLDDGACTCFAMAHTFQPSVAGRAAKFTTLPCDIISEPGAPLDPRLAAALAHDIESGPVASTVELFPNPTEDFTTIRVVEGGLGDVRIFDLTGRLQAEHLNADLNGLSLDLRTLPAGMYVVQVERGAERMMQRLLVR